jgi:hypothetical protein
MTSAYRKEIHSLHKNKKSKKIKKIGMIIFLLNCLSLLYNFIHNNARGHTIVMLHRNMNLKCPKPIIDIICFLLYSNN